MRDDVAGAAIELVTGRLIHGPPPECPTGTPMGAVCVLSAAKSTVKPTPTPTAIVEAHAQEGMWASFGVPLPVGRASALAVSAGGTLYVSTPGLLLVSSGGRAFDVLKQISLSNTVGALALTHDESGLLIAHGSSFALLNLSSLVLQDATLPSLTEYVTGLISEVGWVAAVAGRSLMLLRSRVWLSVSPVPVTGIATDGNVLYALTSNGVLCGAPTPLTLCYPLNVGTSGIVFSQALGVLVTNGSLLYTLNDTHPQAVSLGYPLASTMGGGVLLGLDRGLLRGAAWVSPYSAYSGIIMLAIYVYAILGSVRHPL